VVEGHGIVVGIVLSAGQRHESAVFEELMGHVLLPRHGRRWPAQVAGDKGYSYGHIRRWLRRRRIDPVIPTRKNQPPEEHFDKLQYRKRNLIERVVGWFKECRHLGTRYDKLGVNHLAFWIIACIERLLHIGAVYDE